MAVPRKQIVDTNVTPWYHCISRCVRNTYIRDDLKLMIVERMKCLSEVFTIDTASYGILDTHMHQLLRIDIKRAKRLSRTEVLRRWAKLHPPRGADRKPLKDIRPWIRDKLQDHRFVNEIRRRLCSLSWYMKELKEWTAMAANSLYREEGVFFSGRFKSISVMDEAALLATSIYIDLNPFSAGLSAVPEEASFVSLRLRCASRVKRRQTKPPIRLKPGKPSVGDREKDLWLCPIENRKTNGEGARAGMIDGLTVDSYLKAVDDTARLQRSGKAQLSADTNAILDRLETNATQWEAVFEDLTTRPKLIGVYFSFRRDSLRRAAAKRGCHHVANLNGCPTDLPDERQHG